MIAELAAFNAAFGVVKQFIENGKDLHDCFGQIGQMVNAKEDLKARQQKNKKSLFASDAEEFMALEQIAKAEEELKDFMVYFGRAGLWDDFIIFQAKARKARLEAKNAHIQKDQPKSTLRRSCSWMCLGLCRAIRLLHNNICGCEVAMDALDAIGAIWPIALGFVTLVIVLAKMHADIEQVKEKIRTLFELWNNRNK
jgi:hypothetical protein